jgi:LysM domain
MSTAVLAPHALRSSVRSPVRLTRRGRLLLVGALVLVAFLTITVGQAALGLFDAEAGSSGSSTDAARTWVVQPGETLWSIAVRLDPDTDPRETVARIESMNDLAGSGVLAGQEIFVPAP